MADETPEVVEEQQVAKVIDPTAGVVRPPSAPNVHHAPAAAAPHMEPKWDEAELDPMNRYSIADDPTGERNAARLKDAIDRHETKNLDPMQ